MITFASRYGDTMAVSESIAESLEAFRGWIRSPERPENGRWTYFRGQVLLDMAAEKVNAHAALKSEIHAILYSHATRRCGSDRASRRGSITPMRRSPVSRTRRTIRSKTDRR